MIVVHTDSGLGNQMLDYAEFCLIQKNNPKQECLLETAVYELPHKPGMFSMWNGYELEDIFGIQAPNIKDRFSEESWKRLLLEIEKSEFWKENWNYAPYIVKAFANEGLVLENCGKVPGKDRKNSKNPKDRMRYLLTCFFRKTALGYHIRRLLRTLLQKRLIQKEHGNPRALYRKYPADSYAGHSLKMKYRGFGLENQEAKYREMFRFPEITDEKNKSMQRLVTSVNSVAIHARRGDLLSVNGHCYRYGYFRRAVKYIKKRVENPVFVFFTDEDSVGWCEKNAHIFGLDFAKDKVEFVTWNQGKESYRDMQLMAMCKHNIFTESSFGFWGAYLNENPDKITCAPDVTILATNHF